MMYGLSQPSCWETLWFGVLKSTKVAMTGFELTSHTSFVSIIVSLTFSVLFLLCLSFSTGLGISDFVFGGNCFSHSFLQFLQFVPRCGSLLFPFFPPVRQTTDRIGNRIFLFFRWIIDHKVEARSVNVMNTHTERETHKGQQATSYWHPPTG